MYWYEDWDGDVLRFHDDDNFIFLEVKKTPKGWKLTLNSRWVGSRTNQQILIPKEELDSIGLSYDMELDEEVPLVEPISKGKTRTMMYPAAWVAYDAFIRGEVAYIVLNRGIKVC